MKKIYKIITFLVLMFLWTNITFANNEINPKIEKIVSNFIKKLEKKYTNEQEINYLENINNRINSILLSKKINTKKKKILNDILWLFNEEIYNLNYKNTFLNKKQILLEKMIYNNLNKKINQIITPKYLESVDKKIVKISNKLEFIEESTIKKIIFSKYYQINSSNYNKFNNKKGIFVINELWNVSFVEEYKIETKIKYSNAHNVFWEFLSKKTKFFLQNNTFYSYNFKWYKFFDDKYGFYFSTLKQNNIDINKSILFLWDDNKYSFIIKYNKIKLINSDIIYWIVDKKSFLDDLVNDKLYLTSDTDYLFKKLKSEINKITANKNSKEKIKIIYNFILNNIEYTKNLNLDDKKIFSWILAYKNKSWVCESYVKLMSYSLKFAWIKDARVLRWDVIDAKDFPQIGHAWLKIWNLYYDPTFDDPIWQVKTKEFNEYKYFWLPKDLFYTNRFDFWKTPEYLKAKSLVFRTTLINQNLSKLVNKYKKNEYLILRWVEFNKENKIVIWQDITLEKAKKIIPFFEVTEKSNWELFFYNNGVKKNITKLQYYVVDNKNLWQILAQLNYNTKWLYLFRWTKNWKIEYRLWFNVNIK